MNPVSLNSFSIPLSRSSVVSSTMKLLKCEVCGSTELTKKEGVFVCDYCGAKYSLEEVQSMFNNVRMDVSGSSISIDNRSKIEALMKIAASSFDDGFYKEAGGKVEQVIETDPSIPDAWYLKAMLLIDSNPSEAERLASRGDSFAVNSLGIVTRPMFDELFSIAIVRIANLSGYNDLRILSGEEVVYDKSNATTKNSFCITKGKHHLVFMDSKLNIIIGEHDFDIKGDCTITIAYDNSLLSRILKFYID